MSYTIHEIKEIISPIASKHGVKRVYLFGSCAKNQADDDSDIDLRIEKGKISTLFQLSEFRLDIEDALKIPVDLITSGSNDKEFLEEIKEDEMLIYG